MIQELNGDQRREAVNSRQRFDAWVAARSRADGYRGSMVWAKSKGIEYLRRSYYDKRGRRRQTSLGVRSTDTEALKVEFDRGRSEAKARLASIDEVLSRQAAINRAIGLGRVPLIAARILRALDDARLLGGGIRVVGTNAIFAYEAAAGVFLDPDMTATKDIDLLFDSRASLDFITGESIEPSLLALLRQVDRSFERSPQTFRAVNRDGYLVDLIKPLRDLRETDRTSIGTTGDDLEAVEILGLAWLESAPSFEAVAIDDRGAPLRVIAIDPRVFAAHKLWLSTEPGRDPLRRKRDAMQAEAVGALVSSHLNHLPYEAGELEMLPRTLFDAAKALFQSPPRSPTSWRT